VESEGAAASGQAGVASVQRLPRAGEQARLQLRRLPTPRHSILIMTSDELFDALRGAYPAAHGWMLLPQVRDATGAGSGRTCDGLAMNAWPSRGLEVHGFELKVHRGDWLRELKKPAKAESIFGYCDRWWIVVPEEPASRDRVVVKPAELPSSWGLFVVDSHGKAGQAVQAPKLKPKPLDRAFLAAVLRRLAAVETPEGKIAAAFAKGKDEGEKQGRKLEALRLEHRSRRQELFYQRDSLRHLEQSADRILKNIRKELTAMKELPETEEEDDVPFWQKVIGFFEREYGYNADPEQIPAGGSLLRWALEQRQASRSEVQP
jgi:hypothetical protein